MSNKKWRNPPRTAGQAPAGGGGDVEETGSGSGTVPDPISGRAGDVKEPDPKPPETSTSASRQPSPEDAEAAAHARMVDDYHAEMLRSEEAVALRRMPGPGPALAALPDDYLENGHGGAAPDAPPGCYRTAFGAGTGRPDLRATVPALGRIDQRKGPLTDAEMEYIAGDAVRFLWQVVTLSSRVMDTIEMALPGDVVLQDGSVSRYQDAYRTGAQTGSGSGTVPDPVLAGDSKDPKPKPKARGASHPLMALLRLAVQAARLIRQFGSGTNPGMFGKLRGKTDDIVDRFKAGEEWARSVIKSSG